MKAQKSGLQNATTALLNRALETPSKDIKSGGQVNKATATESAKPVVEKAAEFDATNVGAAKNVLGGDTKTARRSTNGASRGMKLGNRLLTKIKTGAKLASLGAVMALSLLGTQAQAQTTKTSPILARVQMMTQSIQNQVAKNVRTDFVMTNPDNRNEGVIEFRIKDNHANKELVKALTGATEITLPAPWGVGDGFGSSASVEKDGKFLVVRADASGRAFSSVDRDPMLFVQGKSGSGRIDLDVKKLNVNENAFYHGISEASIERQTDQIKGLVANLQERVESGEIAPGSVDVEDAQRTIQQIQENIDVQVKQLGMDWGSTLTIGDGK